MLSVLVANIIIQCGMHTKNMLVFIYFLCYWLHASSPFRDFPFGHFLDRVGGVFWGEIIKTQFIVQSCFTWYSMLIFICLLEYIFLFCQITTYTRDGINKISLTGCDARIFCLGVRIVKRRTLQQVSWSSSNLYVSVYSRALVNMGILIVSVPLYMSNSQFHSYNEFLCLPI